jgi:pimeloyl-ACP methyl ester carboxylesterase
MILGVQSWVTPLVLPRWVHRSRVNPDYPHSDAEVREVLARQRGTPRVPVRPVIVLSGYHSPMAQAQHLAATLRGLTHREAPMACVAYFAAGRMDRIITSARAQVARAMSQHGWSEVDLIGISMGGLIARALASGGALHAACGRIEGAAPINAARVLTIASPHRGAKLAEWVRPDSAARDLRAGSTFLRSLDGQALPRELVCYSPLGDTWVGATRASPQGMGVIWTPGAWVGSHFAATWDMRIVADVAVRLRGEGDGLGRASEPPCD